MISIVVPAYNESSNIEPLAENLASLSGQFEVIIADGGSADNTPEAVNTAFNAAPRRPACTLIQCGKGRAVQMNAGAKAACGDILLFLHADSRLPADALLLIEKAVRDGISAGCFQLRFEPSTFLLRTAAFMSDMRAKYRQTAFGDQGIFVTKELFCRLGGFPDIPLMEDYSFSQTLAQNTRIALLPSYITTSSRRFKNGGTLRTLIKMQYVQHLWRRGMSAEKIAEIYRR